MKIYLAHPITGLSFEEVHTYYQRLRTTLSRRYDVLHPMTAKGFLRNEKEFRSADYHNPCSTNHAITERDRWMIETADVVLVDLTGAKAVSIGCMMELAWAHQMHKHAVVVMEKDNLHRHAFVLECADIIFESLDEAVEYLLKLAEGAW